MIPLSFASILGGTCTLIGTSTNLVVEGMMRERYPDAQPMGLFALSLYGVPVAMSGMAYILIASPFLLPGGRGRRDAASGADGEDDLIEDSLAVGAVVAPKSPVIDQPVATLRGLNGLYLVSVQRGDMLLRAVTPEFLLEEGDVLHFTGLVSSIGEVCVEHGLLPLTHETEVALAGSGGDDGDGGGVAPDAVVVSPDGVSEYERDDARAFKSTDTYPPRRSGRASRRASVDARGDLGARAETLARSRDYKTVLHAFQMDQDLNEYSSRGEESDAGENSTGPESDGGGLGFRVRTGPKRRRRASSNVSARGFSRERTRRRSDGEAASAETDAGFGGGGKPFGGESGDEGAMNMHEVLSAKDTPLGVRRALLERHQILKVRVRAGSSLVGQTAINVGFREKYKAAIIAVKRGGEDQRAANEGKLASVVFEAGDILMLHCLDKCPLLQFKEPALGAARGSVASIANAAAEDAASRRASVDLPRRDDTDRHEAVVEFDGIGDGADGVEHGATANGGSNARAPLAAPVASRPGADTAALLNSPTRPKSASRVSSIAKTFGLASDAVEANVSSGAPSRPGTPGADRSPDADLEVISREGAEDIRAMTDFTCPVRVIPGGAVEGKTLAAAGLRGLPGLFLTAVQTAGEDADAVAAPGPEYVLHGDDILWFAGDAAGISALRRIPGVTAENKQVNKLKLHKTDRRLVQAVIAVGSPLQGRTVRDGRFRTMYDAVIIAVQRSGGRIQAKIGDIVLQAGDVLLLDTGSSFLRTYKGDPAFALVSEIENSAPPQFDKLLPACGTAVVMIAVFVAGALDLFVAALLASGVMLATGCLTQNAARASVNWAVITTIAGAFGISACLENTGVANAIATTLVGGATGVGAGTTGVFVAVYVATFFLCNVVGNNAAAALMYPIAAGAAEQQGIDRDQMAFLLMLAASASFMSPFGYQTNLMVYGPGGYVFADFLRFGVPMQFVQMVVSVGVVLLGNNWWAGWVAGFGAIGGIYVTRLVAAKFGEGEGKRDGEGPGMEKKKLAKIKEEEESGAAVDGARANGVLLAGVV